MTCHQGYDIIKILFIIKGVIRLKRIIMAIVAAILAISLCVPVAAKDPTRPSHAIPGSDDPYYPPLCNNTYREIIPVLENDSSLFAACSYIAVRCSSCGHCFTITFVDTRVTSDVPPRHCPYHYDQYNDESPIYRKEHLKCRRQNTDMIHSF